MRETDRGTGGQAVNAADLEAHRKLQEIWGCFRENSFLDYFDFKVIKGNFLHKAVLIKLCSGFSLKFPDIWIQPDRDSQVKICTNLI